MIFYYVERNLLKVFWVWGLRSSGMLRIFDWQLITDVSGQPVGLIFKGRAMKWGCFSVREDCVTLEAGTDRLSRNVGK
jgi:hypothetical protein